MVYLPKEPTKSGPHFELTSKKYKIKHRQSNEESQQCDTIALICDILNGFDIIFCDIFHAKHVEINQKCKINITS